MAAVVAFLQQMDAGLQQCLQVRHSFVEKLSHLVVSEPFCCTHVLPQTLPCVWLTACTTRYAACICIWQVIIFAMLVLFALSPLMSLQNHLSLDSALAFAVPLTACKQYAAESFQNVLTTRCKAPGPSPQEQPYTAPSPLLLLHPALNGCVQEDGFVPRLSAPPSPSPPKDTTAPLPSCDLVVCRKFTLWT